MHFACLVDLFVNTQSTLQESKVRLTFLFKQGFQYESSGKGT